ncbi:unnamed protein product [Arctogadus glacialis]
MKPHKAPGQQGALPSPPVSAAALVRQKELQSALIDRDSAASDPTWQPQNQPDTGAQAPTVALRTAVLAQAPPGPVHRWVADGRKEG